MSLTPVKSRGPSFLALLLVVCAGLALAVPAVGAVGGSDGTTADATTVDAVATLADGSVVVGGSFTSLTGVPAPHLAHLTLDGSVDPAFSAALGEGFDGPVTMLAVQPDGRIVVGGAFTMLAGTPVDGLARLAADGTPDLGFAAAASLAGLGITGSQVRSVTAQPDGRLVVGGAFGPPADGTARLDVVRLEADGSLDPTFLAPPLAAPPTTLFGTSIYTGDGRSFEDALATANATYGGLDVVRVFYQGLPAPWPGKAGSTGGPVVVSFKASPRAVVAGELDDWFRAWFAAAPRDRDVYWTNFHEPEDNIEEGAFTAEEYKEAFRRLALLAREAANPRLKATTIWMCYDLRPRSGRDWHEYFPGADVVDVMAWDCYNNRGTAHGLYLPPAELLDALRTASESMGKPWGLAEYGSQLVTGDDGTGRAEWLLDSAAYAREHDALWVSYYDTRHRSDYRLLDEPSQAAWRFVVSGT